MYSVENILDRSNLDRQYKEVFHTRFTFATLWEQISFIQGAEILPLLILFYAYKSS